MSRRALESLEHILGEIRYLQKAAAGTGRDEFLGDETLKRAFVRSLEIVGKAAKHVPEEVRNRCDAVDWRAMAGMRDKLIHGYFGVDYDIVWDAVANRLPAIRNEIERLVRDAGQG